MNSSLQIHRLLDEAFAGVAVTDDVQDLKEEMRGNLVARAAELEATGLAPDDAAHRAMAEVGDVNDIVGETMQAGGPTSPWHRSRVRPRPGYVVRTVLLALLGLAAAAVLGLLTADVWAGAKPRLDHALASLVVALTGAAIVGDALRQETTTNYPVTRARAIGYTGATALGLGGLACCVGYLSQADPARAGVPALVLGAVATLASIVAFTYLGATQTNRHKPWVVRERRRHEEAADRFTRDPAAAARFGIYTVTIWILALAAFAVLGFSVGWAWSLLALLAGVAAMMLTLARMLFGEAREQNIRQSGEAREPNIG